MYASQGDSIAVKFEALRYFEGNNPDICPPRHLSPWPIRNRGTNVQGDTCPGGTLVWGDSCLGGQLSWGDSCPGGTFVRGDSCPGGQLSRETNVLN